jgi:uncharacterized iron-regulated membrane protein
MDAWELFFREKSLRRARRRHRVPTLWIVAALGFLAVSTLAIAAGSLLLDDFIDGAWRIGS